MVGSAVDGPAFPLLPSPANHAACAFRRPSPLYSHKKSQNHRPLHDLGQVANQQPSRQRTPFTQPRLTHSVRPPAFISSQPQARFVRGAFQVMAPHEVAPPELKSQATSYGLWRAKQEELERDFQRKEDIAQAEYDLLTSKINRQIDRQQSEYHKKFAFRGQEIERWHDVLDNMDKYHDMLRSTQMDDAKAVFEAKMKKIAGQKKLASAELGAWLKNQLNSFQERPTSSLAARAGSGAGMAGSVSQMMRGPMVQQMARQSPVSSAVSVAARRTVPGPAPLVLSHRQARNPHHMTSGQSSAGNACAVNGHGLPAHQERLSGPNPGVKRQSDSAHPEAKRMKVSKDGHSRQESVEYQDGHVSSPRLMTPQRLTAPDDNLQTPKGTGAEMTGSQSVKEISFDEVYQDGQAKYKHMIQQWPAGSNKYYILRCDEHGVHFNKNPLAGAAKHLASLQHGHQSKERSLAIKLLGIRITDCDHEKMERNNKVAGEAFDEGYKALNVNMMSRAERRSLGIVPGSPAAANFKLTGETSQDGSVGNIQATATPHGVRERAPSSATYPAPSPTKPGEAVLRPTPGELYLGWWAQEKKKYAVLLLPWLSADLRDAGLPGKTLESEGLTSIGVPPCFRVEHGRITGWSPGYEDGGHLEARRKFPVMYFDRTHTVGWHKATDLFHFNFDEAQPGKIPRFKDAVAWYNGIKDGSADGVDVLFGLPSSDQRAPEPSMVASSNGHASDDGDRGSVRAKLKAPAPTEYDDDDTESDVPMLIDGVDSDVVMSQRKVGAAPQQQASMEVQAKPKVGETGKTGNHGDDSLQPAATPPPDPARGTGSGTAGDSGAKETTTTTTSQSPSQSPVAAAKTALARRKPQWAPESQIRRLPPTSRPVSRDPVPVAEKAKLGPSVLPSDQNAATSSPGRNGVQMTATPKPPSQTNGHHRTPTNDGPDNRHPLSSIESNRPQPIDGPRRQSPAPVLTSSADASSRVSTPQGQVSGGTYNPSLTMHGSGILKRAREDMRRREDEAARKEQPQKKTDPPTATGEKASESRPARQEPSTQQQQSAVDKQLVNDQRNDQQPRRAESVASTRSVSTGAGEGPPRTRTPVVPPRYLDNSPALSGGAQFPTLPAAPPSLPPRPPPPASSIKPAAPIKPESIGGARSALADQIGTNKADMFDLSGYRDDKGRSWTRSNKPDGAMLRLSVNPATGRMESPPDAPLHVIVDHNDVVKMTVESLTVESSVSNTAASVTLELRSGGTQVLELEQTDTNGRKENGRIHARRFCKWIKGRNASVEYKNKFLDKVGG